MLGESILADITKEWADRCAQMLIGKPTCKAHIANTSGVIWPTPRRTRQPTEVSAAQIAAWERELNALVYKLYCLTEDEIAIVERRDDASSVTKKPLDTQRL